MKKIILSLAIIGSLVMADVSYAQPQLDINVIIHILNYYGVSDSKIQRIVNIIYEPTPISPVVKPAPKPVKKPVGGQSQKNVICGNTAICVQS